MQAIPDLRFFEIAEIGIEFGEIAVIIAGEARVEVQPIAAGEIENVFLEGGKPAAVKTGSEIVLIHQRFQILQRSIGFRPGQRRREMVNDHRRSAALGLRAFSGVVYNEGIELGQRPMGNFGIAFGAEAIGLARQPFEIAVLAVVNQHMGLEAVAQPEIEGEIAMGRNQRCIMVGGFGVDVVAAGGLDADGHIAGGEHREMKGAVAEEGIGFRNVPARSDLFTDGIGQFDEIFLVFGQTQLHVVRRIEG